MIKNVGTAIIGAGAIWVLWSPLIAPIGRGMFTQRINPSRNASPDSVVQFFSAGTANMIGKGFENYDTENLGRRFDEPNPQIRLPGDDLWLTDPRRYIPFLRPNPQQPQQQQRNLSPHNQVVTPNENCPPDQQWIDATEPDKNPDQPNRLQAIATEPNKTPTQPHLRCPLRYLDRLQAIANFLNKTPYQPDLSCPRRQPHPLNPNRTS
ncbi:hypothetical protein [Oxynema aestuarii]|jgi:hypothetical protein|uniref:hypothetical protein n=1 Tax=Oxynema aestuarii TaxID=2874213 RepID=UPI001FE6D1BB|nr:hypothetical protein [Oxynema aestuarii]